jgi:hypothetical protein
LKYNKIKNRGFIVLASLLALGGNFNNGTNDGVFYFNCPHDFWSAGLLYGAHLLIFIKLLHNVLPTAW